MNCVTWSSMISSAVKFDSLLKRANSPLSTSASTTWLRFHPLRSASRSSRASLSSLSRKEICVPPVEGGREYVLVCCSSAAHRISTKSGPPAKGLFFAMVTTFVIHSSHDNRRRCPSQAYGRRYVIRQGVFDAIQDLLYRCSTPVLSRVSRSCKAYSDDARYTTLRDRHGL